MTAWSSSSYFLPSPAWVTWTLPTPGRGGKSDQAWCKPGEKVIDMPSTKQLWLRKSNETANIAGSP